MTVVKIAYSIGLFSRLVIVFFKKPWALTIKKPASAGFFIG
jgi:hypothetical protein